MKTYDELAEDNYNLSVENENLRKRIEELERALVNKNKGGAYDYK